MPDVSDAVFDFMDDVIDRLREGVEPADQTDVDSLVQTFCENFFDQFLATLDLRVRKFSQPAKRRASALAEELKSDDPDESASVRRLLAFFEEYCDLKADLDAEYGEPDEEGAYEDLRSRFLPDLLEAIEGWAGETDRADTATRASAVRGEYLELDGDAR